MSMNLMTIAFECRHGDGRMFGL